METNEKPALHFPDREQPVNHCDISAIALDANGHIHNRFLSHMQIETGSKLLLLLNGNTRNKYEEGNNYFFHDYVVHVRGQILEAAGNVSEFASIGRKHGWLPMTKIEGAFMIEKIQDVPSLMRFEQPNLYADKRIATCDLYSNAMVRLPDDSMYDAPGRKLYVHGQTIRTVDTYPDDPHGGKPQRLAA